MSCLLNVHGIGLWFRKQLIFYWCKPFVLESGLMYSARSHQATDQRRDRTTEPFFLSLHVLD